MHFWLYSVLDYSSSVWDYHVNESVCVCVCVCVWRYTLKLVSTLKVLGPDFNEVGSVVMLHTSWYLWRCSAYACHCSDWGHDNGFLNGSLAWNFRCLNISSFERKKKKKCSAKVTYVCVHCISNPNFDTLSWPWCWHFFGMEAVFSYCSLCLLYLLYNFIGKRSKREFWSSKEVIIITNYTNICRVPHLEMSPECSTALTIYIALIPASEQTDCSLVICDAEWVHVLWKRNSMGVEKEMGTLPKKGEDRCLNSLD